MIDLHTHSTFSDGTSTPEELINKAYSIGLSALALTDHDTLDGLEEAEFHAAKTGIRLIPGIELEIEHHPGEFHLLGLNLVNWKTSPLESKLNYLRHHRNNRNKEILTRLQNDGYEITEEELKTTAKGRIIARPHIARLLVEKKIAKSMRHAFDKFLGVDQKYYIPKKVMLLEDAVKLILDAGGHPVIAHPLSLYLSWGKLPEKLAEWKSMGIEGIEAWHSGVNTNQGKRLETIAETLGLFITGGSDYHGENRKDRKLGLGGGNRAIPDEFLENLL